MRAGIRTIISQGASRQKPSQRLSVLSSKDSSQPAIDIEINLVNAPRLDSNQDRRVTEVSDREQLETGEIEVGKRRKQEPQSLEVFIEENKIAKEKTSETGLVKEDSVAGSFRLSQEDLFDSHIRISRQQ